MVGIGTHNNKRYLIHNATIKTPRVDPKTGLDHRSLLEVNGHAVEFRTKDRDQPHLLMPNQNPVILSELNEGIINLVRGGYLRLEEVDDIVSALKVHSLGNNQTSKGAAAAAAAAQTGGQSALFNEATAAAGASKYETPKYTRAVEMGRDDYGQKSGSELEGAINPDGNPNFLVRAKTNPKGRQRRERASGGN
jgi:hypothetical protein